MNQEFKRLSEEDGHLATAVVATYFETQKRLALGLAGHPNPLFYRAADRRWYKVDEQAVSKDDQDNYRNMPLGIVHDSVYPTRNLNIEKGDMVLLYSDAFIEAFCPNSNLLGIDGVLDLLNDNCVTDPAVVIPELRKSIRSLSAGNLGGDDATLILGHFTDRKPRLSDTLAAPFRMMRDVRDRTSFGA
jgi:serine phosphatase RsbU (regulator of sigma subunit)